MATITKPNISSLFTSITTNPSSSFNPSTLSFAFKSKTPASKFRTSHTGFIANVTTTSFVPKQEKNKKIQEISYMEEFDESLRLAKNELVLVGFASSHGYQSIEVRKFMYKIATQSKCDFNFLVVIGDQTEDTIKLCKREKVTKVPHFIFYKNMEKVHEEEGFKPNILIDYLFYYGEKNSGVAQMHGREDVDKLNEDHRGKMIVLNVGLDCGPCVRIYPTVINLSRQMADEKVIFARMNAYENESCMEFMREMKVVKVPTFLFIKDGEVHGRYVGCNGGELLREIIKWQRILKHFKRGNSYRGKELVNGRI